MTPLELIVTWLDARAPAGAAEPLAAARAEVAGGVDDARFCALLSGTSRHVRSRPLGLGEPERRAAAELVPGWEPERWTVLEAARVALVLSRPDLETDAAAGALEEAFRYADEGELCALYRSLAFLPAGERFVWRAGEGCRTNMQTVFEADVLDTPFPAAHFDEPTFNQAAVKCLFIGSPLWRLHGLDERLGPELARMALDLADERRSAGRPVQHELWLCLGTHGGERGRGSLERELSSSSTLGRSAAAHGLARAGELERLRELHADERDPEVRAAMERALAGHSGQAEFRSLQPAP